MRKNLFATTPGIIIVGAVIGLFIVTRPSILAEIVSLILCVFLLI